MTRKLFTLAFIFVFSVNARAQMPAPEHYLLLKDLIYEQLPNWNGRLDIYMPKNLKHRAPLLINIHGGGWVHGKKEEETAFAPFFNKEFIIANIEYRLADKAPAPAAIQDVRKAMSYLAERKDSLFFNPNKVVLMGGSAGGHLALMGGLLGIDNRFDPPGKPTMLQPTIIIDKYGPADLLTYEALYKSNKASSAWLGNKSKDTLFIKSISPTSYVRRKEPPVLVIHGDQDKTVPIAQSKMLVEAMQTAKAKVEFYVVKGGKHGNFPEPEKNMVERKIMEFVEHYLKLR